MEHGVEFALGQHIGDPLARRHLLDRNARASLPGQFLVELNEPVDALPGDAVVELEVALRQHRERGLERDHADLLADQVLGLRNAGIDVDEHAVLAEQPAREHRRRGERAAPALRDDVGGQGLLADVELPVPEHAAVAVGAVPVHRVAEPDLEGPQFDSLRQAHRIHEERHVAVETLQRDGQFQPGDGALLPGRREAAGRLYGGPPDSVNRRMDPVWGAWFNASLLVSTSTRARFRGMGRKGREYSEWRSTTNSRCPSPSKRPGPS